MFVREHRLIVNGRDLSDRVAQRIEARLVESPDDLEDRLLLIGYWGHITLARLHADQDAMKVRLAKQEPHVLWLIAKHPSIELGEGPFGLPILSTPATTHAWRMAVHGHPTDALVLWNAARAILFQCLCDPASEIADELVELLARVCNLDPSRVPGVVALCGDRLGLFGKRTDSERAIASCALRCALAALPHVDDAVLAKMTYPMRECARVIGDKEAIAVMRDADQGRDDSVTCRALLMAYAAARG